MLIISHDRYFLDKVANKIWELTSKGLKEYEGNYSIYQREKEAQEKHLAKEYEKQQAKIQQLEEVIDERKGWYKKAHKDAGQNDFYRSKAKKHASVLKAKKRELERLKNNKVEKPERSPSPAFEVINKAIRDKKLPTFLIQGYNLTKSYGQKVIFNNISFNIKRGDKIALLGKNGVGKTTLLKIICGLEEDFQGRVTINPGVKLGYFAQELDNLQGELSILENVLSTETTRNEARLLLASLLFRGDSVFKKVSQLSMGEKGRVAFAKLILSGANLLILDELTNYMDIESQEKIESVLEEFTGTVFFVSHDRYFIKKLANKIFVLEKRELICYEGNYEYYLDKCKKQNLNQEIGEDLGDITDNINRLECELAFLSGRLNEILDEEEKEELDRKFFLAAKKLKEYRRLLGK
jgi:ATPase subunit of ABC transporter with duplicated ATPase domains